MAVIEAIETVYLEADASPVQFGSSGNLIPSTYEHLQVRCSVKTTSATYYDRMIIALGYGSTPTIDNASNYTSRQIYACQSTKTAYSYTAYSIQWYYMGYTTNSDSPYYSGHVIDILDYANTSKNTTLCQQVNTPPYTNTGVSGVSFSSALWDRQDAVTAIKFMSAYGSYLRGSEFTLYGIQE